MALWIVLSLSIIFLIGSSVILFLQSGEIKRRESALLAKLWARANKVPLLLELIKSENLPGVVLSDIIELRSKINTSVDIKERVGLEKMLSQSISDIFQKSEKFSNLLTNTMFLSLKSELGEISEEIHIVINDYNFSVQKWRRYCALPWYKIFEFLFEARGCQPIEPI